MPHELIQETLNLLKQTQGDFAGMGLVVILDSSFLKECTTPLRPEEELKLVEGSKTQNLTETLKLLLKSSDRNHSLHDGFHILNSKYRICGLARLVHPPKSSVPLDSFGGSRHNTAKLISLRKDVLVSVVINSESGVTYFKNGNTYNYGKTVGPYLQESRKI